MKSLHHLCCLGQPVLRAPSGEPIRIRTKKHLALLVYLAIDPGRSHRRDDLAAFLWPRAKAAEARHSLSTALSLFRARLGREAIEANRETIGLKPGRLALDVDRLLAGEIEGDALTPPLEVAGFLDGFDIADAAEFALWKDRQQARLLPAIKQALVTLIDCRRRTGEFQQIEDLADRMLALDDLSEEAIKAKMEARALSGDRITALRIFEDWKAKLASELQATPSEMLQRMAARLRGAGWQPVATPLLRKSSPEYRVRPLIGRATEHQALYKAWALATDGDSHHVLVLGDSGVGKTALIEQFTSAAMLEGASIARVQCYDAEQDIPYSTISALVTQLLNQPGSAAASAEALTELARVAPEVQRRFPFLHPPTDSRGETARIRLTEGFLDLLLAVAEEHPILLIVDDLHFADDASVAVLHLTIRRSRNRPIMALFAARPGELSHSPQVGQLCENALSLGLHKLELSPLSTKDSEELLTSLIPRGDLQPDASSRRLLIHASAGYPMVLELLAQDWQLCGDQSLALAIDAMVENLDDAKRSAGAYHQILDKVTRSLDATARAVLQLASILGHRLNDLDVYYGLDLTEQSVINGLTELVHRRILRDIGGRLEFINELVRTAAYLDVPSPIRKRLHGQIANRLLANNSKNEFGLEIAWHCIRAGRTDEAIAPLLRGAREALRRGAPHSAERALSTALPLLQGQDRTHAMLILIETLQEQCRWQDSLSAIEQLAVYDPREAMNLTRIFRIRAQRQLGHYTTAELPHILYQLKELIVHSTDTQSQINAAVEAASLLSALRAFDAAPDFLDSLVSLQPAILDTDNKAKLLLARAMLLYNLKRCDASIKDVEAGVRILEEQKTINSVMAMLHCGIGSIHALQGNYTAAATSHLQAFEIAFRVGNERVHALAAANVALDYCRLGAYQMALTWSERAADYGHEVQSSAVQAALIAHAMLGQSQRVDAIVETITSRIRRSSPVGLWQAWDLCCADAYFMLSRQNEAEAVARQALYSDTYSGKLLIDSCGGSYARWLGIISCKQGGEQQALDRLSQLEARLTNFDTLDQIEILLAMIYVRTRLQLSNDGRIAEVGKRLNGMPLGVVSQLRQLGMLNPTEPNVQRNHQPGE